MLKHFSEKVPEYADVWLQIAIVESGKELLLSFSCWGMKKSFVLHESQCAVKEAPISDHRVMQET